MTYYIERGELNVLEFISKIKIDKIEPFIKANRNLPLTEIKTALGNDISYPDIKLVISKLNWEKKNNSNDE